MAILVHGHRGARARLPENTIPGFEYAIDAGVDAIELDVAVTRDDVLVLSHDPVLAFGAIRGVTLRELRAEKAGVSIPTLDEVLELAPRGSFEFNIEAKIFAEQPEYTPSPEKFARLALDSIQAHRLESRCVLLSFDFRILHAMKAIAPEIRLSALYEGGSEDFVSVARRGGARIVSPEKSLVTFEKVGAAHEAGLQVVVWTANTRAEWDALISAGVDAIVTDDPGALIGYLKKSGED